MTSEHAPQDSTGRGAGLTRRTMVRTAGKAAWAAPVIVVATSTPARATSHFEVDVVSLTAEHPFLGPTQVDVAFTIQNLGAAVSGIQVLVDVTPTVLATFLGGTVGGGGGFVAGTATPDGLGFEVLFTRGESLATNATASCTFSFTAAGGGSITATVTGPQAGGNAGTTYAAL